MESEKDLGYMYTPTYSLNKGFCLQMGEDPFLVVWKIL